MSRWNISANGSKSRRSSLRYALPFLICPLHAQELEEIVVLAQKRERALQEVPAAVSAYGRERIRLAGIQDIRDVMALSPFLAVHVTQAETAGAIFRMRGIGTGGDNLGLESSVGVFVDGVYRNRNSVALTELGDIQRIELLRGPQSTLFGKNTTAGLIHIITEPPTAESFGGHVSGTLGEFSALRLDGAISGPIADSGFAWRVDAAATQRDGFIENVAAPGVEYNDRDRYMLRGQIYGQIGDSLSLRLIGDYTERSETCCAAVTLISGPSDAALTALGATPSPGAPFDRRITANEQWGYEQGLEEKGLSAELNWDLRNMTVTSITAARDWRAGRSQDADFSDADILYRPRGIYENRFDTVSQELRIAGESGDLSWLVGIYYVDETLEYRDAARVGTDFRNFVNALIVGSGQAALGLLPPGTFTGGEGVVLDSWRQDTTSSALFTHNIWALTDRLSLTLGLRYTAEDKDLSGNLAAANPACLGIAAGVLTVAPLGATLACNPLINPFVDNNPALNPNPAAADGYFDSRRDDEYSGTVNLAYELTDDVLGYVSYSAGYKAGGYNLDRAGLANPLLGQLPRATDLAFDAETVDSYELGAKADFRNGRARVNAAIFYAKFSDYQLNLFNGTNFVVDNKSGVDSKGVEVELQLRPRSGVLIHGGATYTDVRYADSVADPNLAGRQINQAPYWIANAAVTHERTVHRNLKAYVHFNYRHSGDFNTGGDLDPAKKQGAYGIFNARLGLGARDDRWQVDLWSNNLLDEDYRQVVFSAAFRPGTYQAFIGAPRTWGTTVRFNF